MTPTFAAGAITGEKERKTYEMLLGQPASSSSNRLGQVGCSDDYLASFAFFVASGDALSAFRAEVWFYEVIAACVRFLPCSPLA
jgi:hypothetical protein